MINTDLQTRCQGVLAAIRCLGLHVPDEQLMSQIGAQFADLFQPAWQPPDKWDWSRYDSRQSWLQARLNHLGTSELAAAIGYSLDWNSPWSLWEKFQRRQVEDRYLDETAEWGLRHEPCIAQKFSELMHGALALGDSRLLDPGDFFVVRSRETPWLACTPDRLIVDADGIPQAVVEIKTGNFRRAKQFEEALPMEYRIQVQGQMYVLGLNRAYYAVLRWGTNFTYYIEERHDKLIEAMLKRAGQFWQYVTDRVPPPADCSEATSRAIAAYYAEAEDDNKQLGDEFVPLSLEYRQLTEGIERQTKRLTAIKNIVKAELGTASIGLLPQGEGQFSWAADKRGRRTFRAHFGASEEPDLTTERN